MVKPLRILQQSWRLPQLIMKLIVLKILKYLAISVVVIIIAIFLSLKWAFWEPSDIQQNSFFYYLKVPKYAKEFPLWGIVDTPTYDVRYADGEKKSVTIIHYISSLNQHEFLETAKKKAFGCHLLNEEEGACEKKIDIGQFVEIDFVKQMETTYLKVTVAFIGF